MKHGSLFSGIGGFDLAAEWMGWENIFHCELNPFGQKVLKHHFPKSISYEDITKTDFSIHRGDIDILTGGFPCQPYSSAGKRLGKADERHLFPEMLRAVKEIKPRWIVGENVRGLISWNGGLVFHEVQDDLEREGYEVQSFLIPAASVNAPHQRYRIWFVAYSNSLRLEHSKKRGDIHRSTSKTQSQGSKPTESIETNGKVRNATNTDSGGLEGTAEKGWDSQYAEWENSLDGKEQNATDSNSKMLECGNRLGKNRWHNEAFGIESFDGTRKWEIFPTKSPVCGGDDGLPRELDNITFSRWRKESIKAYGNAIVPQVALQIFKTIKEFEASTQ